MSHQPTEATRAAQRFIEQHYGARASRLELLGEGEWSQAYACCLDDQEVVIKFGVYGEDFAKDRAMGLMGAAALPVPAVLELGPTPDGYFAVSERRYGRFLDDLSGRELTEALPRLLAALDVLRDLDAASLPDSQLWRREGTTGGWAKRLLSVGQETPGVPWHRAREESPQGMGPFDAAMAVLRELIEDLSDEPCGFVHGDLLNRNVLIQGDQVSAVLDWGNSLSGDHLYDAAWLLFWQSWYPRWAGVDVRAILDQHLTATGGVPADAETRLRCYQLHIGLDAMSYNAFRRRWDELEINTAKTLAIVERVGQARSVHRPQLEEGRPPLQ